MAKKRAKAYVIWNTSNRGVYHQKWEKIMHLVIGVKGVLYNGFKTLHEAQKAFNIGYEAFYGISPPIEEVDFWESPIQPPNYECSTQPEVEEDDPPF